MGSRWFTAGERPITIPPSDLAPFDAQYGNPVVAPSTNTQPLRMISRPISSPRLKASTPQWPVPAAPETQTLYFNPVEAGSVLGCLVMQITSAIYSNTISSFSEGVTASTAM